MNERSATTRSNRPCVGSGRACGCSAARALRLGVVTQPRVQLPVADVDRDDLRRAVLAGGSRVKPPVDAPASSARRPSTSMAKRSERCDELVAPSAHEARGGPSELDRAHARATIRLGLSARRAPDRDEPRVDRPLRRLTARGEPAAHELGVEPATSARSRLRCRCLLARLRLLAGAFLAVDFFAADFFAAAFFAGAFFVLDDFFARRRSSSRRPCARARRDPAFVAKPSVEQLIHHLGAHRVDGRARCSHGCGRPAPAPAAGSARSGARPPAPGWRRPPRPWPESSG